MRDMFAAALKQAVDAKDARRISTIRLINAAVRDRDNANRAAGKDSVCDDDIQQILLKMIRQRQVAARTYEEEARLELAQQELDEIGIIRSFLPAQLSDEDVKAACERVIQETGAQGLRDMGRCMNALKSEFAGQMDFSKASGVVKGMLHHD